MNIVEILRGIGNIALVMAVAGGVAYVGDRVGHQVGRRRLTLYGIRPRYTSTIVAIVTGMVIALVVTLVAIFASKEVQTAFFRLSSLNQQISELQTREQGLEEKVNQGTLVWPVDQLMVPFYRIIDQHATSAQRMATVRGFYDDAVKYLNANYPRYGLHPYVKQPDLDKKLESVAETASRLPANAMLTVTSDQNLFVNDEIHFGINVIPDQIGYRKGQVIAQLTIPGKSGASMNIALGQLLNAISISARRTGLPQFLANNVQPLQVIPDVTQMQQMINKSGAYVLTAFAAEDFYPHLGGIPVVIVLTQQPSA
ncbi:MAG: DUF3084 domain-containing protein [Candidatus Eremiobacteraeota bacterium]|nr:DUF3084 domain-containing protein [Candidatus Eremiobacteraeota bacterium]MBV8285041.1 DUF3084 domain-containing protein [Candidatus Eremiobacteraeota bacterium]MBV8332571.1 DUF3084 domain-containing protein [Candidatus Eremiobacteraeota bacterium]MBV8432782.1 DUF3084 domain-containing protein [Candidatus Eremiobacteraeota bacterium]MBV8722723.1 DUF3084 domain-containing protein [Candidatus Eremiobacteraeota bacterium]